MGQLSVSGFFLTRFCLWNAAVGFETSAGRLVTRYAATAAPATTATKPPTSASRRATLQERQMFSRRPIREARHGRERFRRDLEIAVEGDAAAVGRRLGGEVRTHERFATATVHTAGLELDLATSRSE